MDFIHKDLPKSDIDLFGLDNPIEFECHDFVTLLVDAKIFPSKGQAKKAGWSNNNGIPPGFNEIRIGKRHITILNWFTE